MFIRFLVLGLVASAGTLAVAQPFPSKAVKIVVGSTPEQFGAFLMEENVRWSKAVKDLNLRAEQ